ncbi:MAG TPA: hypothetical protein DCK98_10055 [Chloroflexi bacterium]|jgi:multiple sugar transport system substrate-binding protein|nr:hypothetical protein [Chloroflexota bacterium]HAL26338.1 hypothetical protein [Chloroflexota bacterium]
MDAKTPSTLSRRRLLEGFAASLAVPIAAACTTDFSHRTEPPASQTIRAPATAKGIGRSLAILQGAHVVPEFDAYVDGWAADWGARSGVAVRIDRIPPADLPARIAVEAAARSGHDLVGHFAYGLPVLFTSSLIDVSDVCDRAAANYGGWLAAGEAIGKVKAKWYGYPEFAVPFLSSWRTDLWKKVGFAKAHLETWDDLFDNAGKLNAAGSPVGTAMSQTSDAEHTWRSLMWSYGAAEFSADGSQVAIDSRETRQVLDLTKALFSQEEPAVISWSDFGNDNHLRSGKGSWICDRIDAYRAIEARDPVLAEKIAVDGPLKGPVAQIGSMQFTVYGIWNFSKNVDAARQFLTDYSDDWPNQMTASKGYNIPFLKGHAQKPMPVLGADKKLTHLQDIATAVRPVGYPGPPSAAAYDALQTHVVTDMFTSYCTGKRSADDAIAEAARRLKDSLARFPI